MTTSSVSLASNNNLRMAENLEGRARLSCGTRLWSYIGSPDAIPSIMTLVALAGIGCSLPVVAVSVGVLSGVTSGIKTILGGGKALRPAVFLGAEELTREGLEGGIMSVTIPPVLESLKERSTPNVTKTVKCLENMLYYVENFDYSGLGNRELITYQQTLLKNLKTGEMTALPCSWFAPTNGLGHVMVLAVQRQQDERFIVRVYNGGEGVHYHSSKTISIEDLSITYVQATCEIENIELDNLMSFIPALVALHTIRIGNSSQKLYEELLPMLHGTYSEPIEDQRFWGPPQTGNSCSGYSIKLFVRSMLTEDEYSTFESIFFSKMKDELQNGLQSHYRFWEQTPDHALVLREMQMRLDSNQVPPLLNASLLGKMAFRGQRAFWNNVFRKSSGSPDIVWNQHIVRNQHAVTSIMTHPIAKALSQSFEYCKEKKWALSHKEFMKAHKSIMEDSMDQIITSIEEFNDVGRQLEAYFKKHPQKLLEGSVEEIEFHIANYFLFDCLQKRIAAEDVAIKLKVSLPPLWGKEFIHASLFWKLDGKLQQSPWQQQMEEYRKKNEEMSKNIHKIRAEESFLSRTQKGKALIQAVEQDNLEMVQLLSANGMDPYEKGKALVTAVEQGNLEIMKELLNSDEMNEYKKGEALVTAVEKGYVEMVQLLSASDGMDPYKKGEALLKAVDKGDAEMVQLLSASDGMDPYKKGDALIKAVDKGDAKMVELLSASDGIDEYHKGDALIKAVDKGDAEMVQLLLASNGIPNYQRGYALLKAIECRNEKIMNLLLSSGKFSNFEKEAAIKSAKKAGINIVF